MRPPRRLSGRFLPTTTKAAPMAFTMDPQVEEALAPMLEAAQDVTPPAVGDVAGRRPLLDQMLSDSNNRPPLPDDVTRTDHQLPVGDGVFMLARWYEKTDAAPGSAVLYLHGGGMVSGSIDTHDGTLARYVSRTGVPMLSADYRLAPEHPYPTPLNDAFTALTWLSEHADDLGVDRGRIAVMGESAGAGLAASLALLARDRGGPSVVAQILVYPMLDDRTTIPDPEILEFIAWTYDDNVTAWGAILGDRAGGDDVPDYAAPARAASAVDLPPAYIEVGQLDIFRDECLGYAAGLSRAGVNVEFHLRPGVPHGFDAAAPDTDVSRRAHDDRARVLEAL
jgi:acetyl esterase/lipase